MKLFNLFLRNYYLICLLLFLTGCLNNNLEPIDEFFSEVIPMSSSKPSKPSNSQKCERRIFVSIDGKLIGQSDIEIDSINEKKGIIVVYSIKDKQYHLFNNKWEKISEGFDYISNIYELNSDLISVQKNDKFGYINLHGKLIIPCKFYRAHDFNDGLAVVSMLDRGKLPYYFYINKLGKKAFSKVYSKAYRFNDGVAHVQTEQNNNGNIINHYGLINTRGELIFAVSQEKFNIFDSEGDDGTFRISVLRDDDIQFGYINFKGKVILPAQYYFCDIFNKGFGIVLSAGKYYLVDKNGNLNPTKYHWVGYFSEGIGLAVEQKKGGKPKYWFIDDKYKLIIHRSFDDAKKFHKGLAAVKINGKWGFINKTGEIVIKAEYDEVLFDFEYQVALVVKAGKVINIDQNGKYLFTVPEKFTQKAPMVFDRIILKFE